MCVSEKSASKSVGCIRGRVNDQRSREATLSTAIIRNSVGRATTTLPRLREPRVFQRSVNDSWKKNHLRKRDACNASKSMRKRSVSDIVLCACRNRSSV
ncbi:hypothetical protein WN48_00571 [Eufriesea mexicana]|nr:hypothetical protein WN48_00571 [Eufriesea mexicana]